MDNPCRFYVYAYLRSRPSKYGEIGSPYYIGKGQTDRRFSKLHNAKPPQDPVNNVLLKEGLAETDALEEEIRLIKLYGRIDIGTGCLRNRTDGGDGASGFIHPPESKEKMRLSHAREVRGPRSQETRDRMSRAHLGKKKSPEAAKKSRLARTGVKRSPEFRERMRLFQSSPATKEKIRLAKEAKGYKTQVADNAIGYLT
jgi:hypothetical protein